MGGKGSGRRKVIREDPSFNKGVAISLPSSIRSDKSKPVKVITLPPAAFREVPPLSKHKRTRLKKDPPPLPENSVVKMVHPEDLDKVPEPEPENLKPEPELVEVLSRPKDDKEDLKRRVNKVKQLTLAPPPVMSTTEVKTYREYCLSVIDKAEKSGLMKELVLLLSAFRVMFQKQIYRATEEPAAPAPAHSVPSSQRGKRYSKRSE